MCQSCLNKKVGRLELIVGCMFAGKTEEFIRRIRRLHYAKITTVVFKPEIDDRYLKKDVTSHNLNHIKSVVVKNSQAIVKYVKDHQDIQAIGIDEIQFFDAGIVGLINELVDKNYIIIATGLDLDYQAHPFANVKELLPVAEYITKLHAICIKCGNLANRTYRIPNKESNDHKKLILIGSSDVYEARCRTCYKLK